MGELIPARVSLSRNYPYKNRAQISPIDLFRPPFRPSLPPLSLSLSLSRFLALVG